MHELAYGSHSLYVKCPWSPLAKIKIRPRSKPKPTLSSLKFFICSAPKCWLFAPFYATNMVESCSASMQPWAAKLQLRPPKANYTNCQTLEFLQPWTWGPILFPVLMQPMEQIGFFKIKSTPINKMKFNQWPH